MRLDIVAPEPFGSPMEHLRAELSIINALLAAHVESLRGDGAFNDDPLRGLILRDEEVCATLARVPSGSPAEPIALRNVIDRRLAAGPEMPLMAIQRLFGLSEFERRALLLAVASGIDRRYQTAFAYAQNDVSRRWPTVELAINLFAGNADDRMASLTRFMPDARLFAHRLISIAPGEEQRPLADRGLVVDDRIIAEILGISGKPDLRLGNAMRYPSQFKTAEKPPLRLISEDIKGPVIFESAQDVGQHLVARQAALEWNLNLVELDLNLLRSKPEMASELGHIAGREALLCEAALFVTGAGDWSAHDIEQLLDGVSATYCRLFIDVPTNCYDRTNLIRSRNATIARLPSPNLEVRAQWWRHATHCPTHAAKLAWSSCLGPAEIARIIQDHDEGMITNLDQAVEARRSAHLPRLMEQIESCWQWEDLVLPSLQRSQLQDIGNSVRNWPTVLEHWKFSEKMQHPRNCVVLFSGASGTGKTMAAALVAGLAGVPIYRVNLAAIFDKYIGETEKHLDRLFDAAARAGVAIFFDEADVLFSKRTEVRNSNDRYANLSVGYVLQRIEGFDGLAILASNLPGNMDDAFSRRLSHIIAFPMPDATMRKLLWAAAFPAAAPLDVDVDLAGIAETFELSGGNIRNAAIAAAYLGADEGDTICNRHIVRAVSRELAKMGRAPIDADFGALQHHR